MTTLAKIEANRRNAQLSTGPRTPQGKARVARNAVKHGIFALVPVLPGESPFNWDQHRTGIIVSLAPVGLLEVNLAERIAMLLWQLARLARYQAAAITAEIEDAGLLPVGVDPFVASLHRPTPDTEDYLKMSDQRLRLARVNYAEVLATADLLRHLGDSEDAEPYRTDHVVALLGWSHGETFDYPFRRFDPEFYLDGSFLPRIGISGTGVRDVVWTPELLGRALDYYADVVGSPNAEFRTHMQTALDRRVAALAREVRRLEADATAIVRRAENSRSRAADAALLPPPAVIDKVVKYEKHLHGLLSSTFRELERLRAWRVGMPVVPPLAADVHLTVSAEPG